MNRFFIFTTILGLSFSGCSQKEFIDSIESIYTDTIVIKASDPYSEKNVEKINKYAPILSQPKTDDKPDKKSFDPTAPVSNYIGRLVTSRHDPDVDLFLYKLSIENSTNYITFYHTDKLSYTHEDIVEVEIQNGFLVSIQRYKANPRDFINHKKRSSSQRNYKIPVPIEEKLDI